MVPPRPEGLAMDNPTDDKLAAPGGFNVGGIGLDRPFRIRRLGHFGYNVESVADNLPLYRDLLGFYVSDVLDFARTPGFPTDFEGETVGYFMRHGTDHHSFVLFPKGIFVNRPDRPRPPPGITINQITWQVGSLREVTEATSWMEERHVAIARTGRD